MTTLILCMSRGGLLILHGGLYFHSLGVEMLKLKWQFPAEDVGYITCSKEQSDDLIMVIQYLRGKRFVIKMLLY